ncbi:YCF48-related protein [Pseudomonas sp. sp1636]|uniref:WD40/YVTN/BNR-like repeat-containing protein n=1 Tax=Pseudomonas sp. sp1636 TaxID=3036707 RepID=UPI0025A52C48|nr:YCF48-related protein [Pseudomonas sp. sp1636]MDM8350154.1 YCF48-related protein [Pseudomonas sp. sp1636]
MSEPVTRRTRAGLFNAPALRFYSPLAKALSLCSVLSVVLFAAAPLQAQTAADSAVRYSIESPSAVKKLLLDVTRVGQRLVAVGDRGHILYSDDNAVSWTQAKVPTRQMLTAVFFVDDQHGWAVGHDAQILASNDGGATWVKQFEDQEREAGSPFLDVWFKDLNNGFVVGAYGALYATTDGGKNWEDVGDRLDSEDGYHLNAIVAVKDAGLFVVGELGGMFRSADWGQTWETIQGPYEGSLFGALGTSETGSLLVYGLRGHMFRSSDFGDSWQQIELNTPNNGPLEFGLADGNQLADGSIVVVGHGGTVLKSSDDGRTFSLLNRVDRLSLAGVTALDNGNLILVGQGGVLVAAPTGADLGQQ